MGFQILGASRQLQHMGTVNSLAHLGGCLAGIAAWMVWKKIDVWPAPEVTRSPLVITRR